MFGTKVINKRPTLLAFFFQPGMEILAAGGLAFIVALGFNPRLQTFVEGDTSGYVQLASNLLGEAARSRPPAYPVLIRTAMLIGSSQWSSLIALIQICMIAGIAALIALVCYRLAIRPIATMVVALLVTVLPGLQISASLILPELALAFFVTLSWVQTIILLTTKTASLQRRLLYAALIGLWSGLAVMTKPVWLLGILPLLGAVVWANRSSLRQSAVIIMTMLAVHGAICLAWQVVLLVQFQQKTISDVASVNINLAIMRAGLTRRAEGTSLYNFLQREGILDEALSLKWDDFDKFTAIKDKIPWQERADPLFYSAALSKDGLAFVSIQISRWPRFFTTRPGTQQTNTFQNMPQLVKYLYQGFFNVLFRPLLPILLMIAIGLIFVQRLRSVLIVSLLTILYFSSVLAVLTYQDPHYIRMRVAVEPIMIFVALLPLYFISEKLLHLFVKRWERVH